MIVSAVLAFSNLTLASYGLLVAAVLKSLGYDARLSAWLLGGIAGFIFRRCTGCKLLHLSWQGRAAWAALLSHGVRR